MSFNGPIFMILWVFKDHVCVAERNGPVGQLRCLKLPCPEVMFGNWN